MRRLAGALAVLSFCAAGAPEARAAGTCVYDAATKTVTAKAASGVQDAYLRVEMDGRLKLEGTPCGDATTANTTAVNVDASGRYFRLVLQSPVTTTLFTVTNAPTQISVFTELVNTPVHWTAGRLADGRWAVDLDGNGQAELVSRSFRLYLLGSFTHDVLSGAGGFKGPGGAAVGPVYGEAILIGRTGNDTLTGPGRLEPDAGNDTLIAGPPGPTMLWHSAAPESLRMKPDLSGTEPGGDGYGGTDSYTGLAALPGLIVHATHHDDVLYGGPGDDDITSLSGDDQVFGMGGADRLRGRAGADTLEGGPGNDVVAGNDVNAPGSDLANVLRGGPGADVYHGGSAGDDFGPLDDDEADDVRCYGGTDTGRPDRIDTLAECEFAAPTLSFAPAPASVDEGAAAQLKLTLSYALDIPAAVDVLTVDDTATSGSDYTPVARRVTFAAGETEATIDVAAPADDEDEPAETFTLALANPSNAPALGSNAAIVVNDMNAVSTSVTVGPAPGTGAGGTYLVPPTAAVKAPAAATEVRCVLDPATNPANFADIPAGDCAYSGDGRKVDANGAHTLCAASTSTTTGETTAVACASWTTDATPPTVTCAPASFKVGDRGRVVTATVADATSGPVTVNLSAPADTATSGEKTATFVARDKAGNATTVKCAYSVSSVALCGQPLVLLSVQPIGRRVRLGGLAAPSYAGKTVAVRASGKPVGTATVARDGSFTVVVKAPRRTGARYQATLPDGASTPAHKLARSLVITKRSGTTVHGRIVARKDLRPRRVSFYRQNTCTSQRAFATAKVSKSGAFKIKLAGPVSPEPIALYRVKARIGKNSRYTSYTLPIVVKG